MASVRPSGEKETAKTTSSKLVGVPVVVLLWPLVGRANTSNAILRTASNSAQGLPGGNDRNLCFGNLIECIIDGKNGER